MKYVTTITLAIISILLTSCGNQSYTKKAFKEFSGPSIKDLGIKKSSPSEVFIRPVPAYALKSKSGMNKWRSSLRSKGLIQLGSSEYTNEGRADITDIRNTAASLGARVVYLNTNYLGRGQKTISVPVSHTPGRTISSSSNTYGSLNTNSYSYGSIGSTPYYGNSYGSGSYSGTTNSSTYIPSSTTYAARQVGYSAYGVSALFCVPESSLSDSGKQKLKQYREDNRNY